jgi:hypothetical protein
MGTINWYLCQVNAKHVHAELIRQATAARLAKCAPCVTVLARARVWLAALRAAALAAHDAAAAVLRLCRLRPSLRHTGSFK